MPVVLSGFFIMGICTQRKRSFIKRFKINIVFKGVLWYNIIRGDNFEN